MKRIWVGVASLDHVRAAVEGGFFQANHGRKGPLQRIARGDRVLIYSPRAAMGPGDVLQAFTAAGEVLDDAPYQAYQTATFRPFRRKVRYAAVAQVPIRPLLDRLSFSRGNPRWGQVLRRGFFEIDAHDHAIITSAMHPDVPGNGT